MNDDPNTWAIGDLVITATDPHVPMGWSWNYPIPFDVGEKGIVESISGPHEFRTSDGRSREWWDIWIRFSNGYHLYVTDRVFIELFDPIEE